MGNPKDVPALAKSLRIVETQNLRDANETVTKLTDQLKPLEAQAEERIVLEQLIASVPALETLERLTRYESHLAKMLNTTLDQLTRLKVARTAS